MQETITSFWRLGSSGIHHALLSHLAPAHGLGGFRKDLAPSLPGESRNSVMDLTDRPPAGSPWPTAAPPAAEEQMAAGRRAGVRPGRLSCADKVPFGST